MPFFKFSARQFWTTIFLFTIILFFILPVPVLMIISGNAPLDIREIESLKRDFASEWPEIIRYFTVIAMSAFAIVLSCSRFKYLKNKVSVDFYHSLPIKRGQLFLTQLAISALSLIIPYLFNVIFTLIVLAANGLVTSALILNILAVTVDTFVYALFFYGLSTLVGMISGLTPVQLTLTAVAVFIIPAAYALSVGFISMFSEHMWVDFYLHADVFEKMTPALRFLINGEVLNIWEILGLLVVSAAMLVGAYAIYMYRKSERSGTPVVFTPLGEVIKYIIVFVGTIGGGLFFYAIMGDYFWMVFGMICGALLTFMLANTILNKTAKAMFKGWKGLCIFGGAAAIAFIVLSTNAFGVNTHVPSPAFTSKVSVNFEDAGGTMVFRDKEAVEALHYIYEKSPILGYDRAYLYPDDLPYNHAEAVYRYVSDVMRVDIVFYSKLGIPTAKQIYVYDKEEFADQFKAILNSDEFKEQYASELENVDGGGSIYMEFPTISRAEGEAYVYTSRSRRNRFNSTTPFDEVKKECGLHTMLDEMENVNFDFFQQQALGYSRISAGDLYVTLPLFASMTKTADFLDAKGFTEYSADTVCEALSEQVTEFSILGFDKNGKVKIMKITDKEQILEILKASANPFGSHTSSFTLIDTRYIIDYEISTSGFVEVSYFVDENGVEHEIFEYKKDGEVYTEAYRAEFLLGKVPEFVVEYFSE